MDSSKKLIKKDATNEVEKAVFNRISELTRKANEKKYSLRRVLSLFR